MTVIELGEVGAAGPEPERQPAGAEFNPRHWRRWASGGVVLLCLVVLAASGLDELARDATFSVADAVALAQTGGPQT